MDDLSKIRGIRAATAKKLVAAGIDTFAKLALATTQQLEVAKVANPADWTKWIAEAASLAPPEVVQLRELTEVEVLALVQSWDDARAELNAAGEASAAVQYQLDTIETGTDNTQITAALVIAKERVTAAHATIDALRPLPAGARLPEAKGRPATPPTPSVEAAPAALHSLTDLDVLFIAEVNRLAGEYGTTPAAILETVRGFLSGRDDLTKDLIVEGPVGIEDFGTHMAAAHLELDELMDDTHTGITVIGPVAGRRRAGFDFGAAPRSIFVTPDQLALIKADDSLSVSSGTLAAIVGLDGGRLTIEDFDFGEAANVLVNVLGPTKGRRRAGFEFGSAAQQVIVDRGQLAIILSDETLAVTPA